MEISALPAIKRSLSRLAWMLLLLVTVAGCGASSPGQTLATPAAAAGTTTLASATAERRAAPAATANAVQQAATAIQAVASLAAAAQAPTPTPVPLMSRPLEGILPRQVQYANMQFQVTTATITNQDPSGQTVADRAFAYLSVTVVNSGLEAQAIGQNLLKLSLSDNQRYQEESGATLSLARDTTGTLKLTYQVPPNATWDRASLVLDRPEKEPALLPLYGPVPTPPFPIKLAAAGEAKAAPLTYKVTAATLDLDYNGQRADKGRRFLILSLVFVADPPSKDNWTTGCAALTDSCFRLLVDGLPSAPLKAPLQLISRGSSSNGQVVFQLPATSNQVDLQVGDAGSGTTATIPLSTKTP
ncbi:MAG TPA: hypothetical protein VGP33_07320 [Chloroflexota bacterium]|nr:hypothetical protein [Chloroflexota bacterium]